MAYVHVDSENKLPVFTYGSIVDEFSYTGNINTTTFIIGDDGNSASVSDPSWMYGYISNLRIVKNTALYTSNFTPVTTALSG